jgi:hypothetical protein
LYLDGIGKHDRTLGAGHGQNPGTGCRSFTQTSLKIRPFDIYPRRFFQGLHP